MLCIYLFSPKQQERRERSERLTRVKARQQRALGEPEIPQEKQAQGGARVPRRCADAPPDGLYLFHT